MAVSRTLQVGATYPVGETVYVFEGSLPDSSFAGNFPGSPVGSSTVSASGTVTFTTLEPATSYVMQGLVGGTYEFIEFRTDTASGGLTIDETGLLSDGSDSVVFASTQPFNVKRYGAVGDGVTDDRVAVQAAIDAAHAEYVDTGRQQTVFFPGGVYHLPTQPDAFAPVWPNLGYGHRASVALKSGVRLLAFGDAVFLHSTMEDFDSIVGVADDMVTFDASDWAIEGIVFDAEAADQNEINAEFIAIGVAHNWVIRNCVFRNTQGDGILVYSSATEGCTNWRIEGNEYTEGSGQLLVMMSGAAGFPNERGWIVDNLLHNQRTVAEPIIIGGTITTDVQLRDVVIRGNQFHGVGSLTAGFVENVVMTENTLSLAAGSLRPAVYLFGGGPFILANNFMDMSAATTASGANDSGALQAIEQSTHDVHVLNNHMVAGADSIVYTQAGGTPHERWKVEGNTIIGSADAAGAIVIKDTVDITIANNQIDGAGVLDIGTFNQSRAKILHNTINGQGRVISQDESLVEGNTITNAGPFASAVKVGARSRVAHNRLTGEGVAAFGVVHTDDDEVAVESNIIELTGAGGYYVTNAGGADRLYALDNIDIATAAPSGDGYIVNGANSVKRVL